jgi:acyl-CoA thioesterase FadM
MNLILRMIKVLVAALFGQPLGILDSSVLTFRVWPNDLDINLHMNNGRYLTIMDLGRIDLLIRWGLGGVMVKRRWMPVVGAATIQFRRSLSPFQRFRLHTRVLCWDEKWVFVEQRIESLDGRVAATAIVKGLVRGPTGLVAPATVLSALGLNLPSPPVPIAVSAWIAGS